MKISCFFFVQSFEYDNAEDCIRLSKVCLKSENSSCIARNFLIKAQLSAEEFFLSAGACILDDDSRSLASLEINDSATLELSARLLGG